MILDVIDSYVPLIKHGDLHAGTCPFCKHSRSRIGDSFVVRSSLEEWHCFNCGRGGDVYDFVSQLENCSLEEAKEKLVKFQLSKVSKAIETSKTDPVDKAKKTDKADKAEKDSKPPEKSKPAKESKPAKNSKSAKDNKSAKNASYRESKEGVSFLESILNKVNMGKKVKGAALFDNDKKEYAQSGDLNLEMGQLLDDYFALGAKLGKSLVGEPKSLKGQKFHLSMNLGDQSFILIGMDNKSVMLQVESRDTALIRVKLGQLSF